MSVISNDRGGTDRGDASLIGTVLLIGIILLVTTAIIAAGAATIQDSRSEATFQQARFGMQELDDTAELVASNSTSRSQVDIGEQGASDIFVDENAGEVTFNVTKADGTSWEKSETLGKVTYTQDGRELAYQAGGIWQAERDGVVVVSPPPIEHRSESDDPTLSFPLTVVRGDGDGGSLTVQRQGGPTALVPPKHRPLSDGSTVNITVQSDYYEGWGHVMDQRTNGTVTYDHPNDSVTLTMDATSTSTNAGPMDHALLSPRAGGKISNTALIDSYDSSAGSYTGTSGENAVVAAGGDFKGTNDGLVKGDLHVDGDYTGSQNSHVTGDTFVSGDSDITNGHEFDGEYSTGGSFKSQGSSGNKIEFHDDVMVGTDAGTTHYNIQKTTIHGTLYAGGDVVLGKDTTIKGDLIAGGDVKIVDGATVEGNVEAGGDVTFNQPTGPYNSLDTVRAGGDIVVDGSNAEVKPEGGEVYADGEVRIKGVRAKLQADVYAGSDADGDGNDDGIELLNTDTEIQGDATTAADGISTDGHNAEVTGTRTTGTSVPDANPSSVKSPTSPTVSTRDPAKKFVEDKEGLKTDNDNAGSAIGPSNDLKPGTAIEVGGGSATCISPCELTAGEYYIDQLVVGEDERLDIKTGSGDVDIYVDGEVVVKNEGEIHVSGSGDNRVNIYNAGSRFELTKGSSVTTEDQRASLLWVYMAGGSTGGVDREFKVGGDEDDETKFMGVVYGAGDGQPGVNLKLDNHAKVYGTLLGEIHKISNHAEIHYDEALTGVSPPGPEDTDDTVTYLQVTKTTVDVED